MARGENDIPVSVWRGEFTLFGVKLHCHVLSDGRKIIEADDIAKLFSAKPIDPDDAALNEMRELFAWCKGVQ